MAINPIMLAAIKALSYPESDLRKTYKLERKIVGLAHPQLMKPFFKIWDRKVTVGDHQVPVRIFFPSEEGTYPLIIYFHGGGFVTGNIDSYSNLCHYMAQTTQHIVLSVDYRLAPEHPFPAAVEDCYAVVKEVVTNALLFQITPDEITLAGDSAGGNLAAVISLMGRDRGEFQINKQILLYPLVSNDHSESSPYASVHENGTDYFLTTKRINNYIDLYITKREDLTNPYFAPILAEDLSNQPETLIVTAEFDPLRDEGEAYGERLRESGNVVEIYRMPDVLHGFFSLSPLKQEVKSCYTLINEFLKRR